MKKVNIVMSQYSFMYNNENYDYYTLRDAVDLMNVHMRIIILEEPLFIKIFKIRNNVNRLSTFIQNKIDNIFPQNGEILYDYERNRKDKLLAIYSIKGKKKIEMLGMNAKELEVIPIQFMVRDIFIKKLKNKKLTCSVVFKMGDNFYYLYIKNGLLSENYINNNVDEIFQKVSDNISNVYIDQNIDYKNTRKDDINLIKMDTEELINEWIFKK